MTLTSCTCIFVKIIRLVREHNVVDVYSVQGQLCRKVYNRQNPTWLTATQFIIFPEKQQLFSSHNLYALPEKRLLSSHNLYSFPTPRKRSEKGLFKAAPRKCSEKGLFKAATRKRSEKALF
jgi:hypothetical protein